MRKLKQILNDRRGTSFPLTVAVTLSLLLIFCGVSEYFQLMIVAQGVRDALQSAVIATVDDNYDEVYHCIREGYSGAYLPDAGSFEESLDYGDVYDRLDDVLGLEDNGDYHTKYTSEGKTEFRISGLDVEIQNAPLAGGDQASTRLIADSTVQLEVPVSFCGKLLPSMQIKVKMRAGYIPRF